MVKLYELTAQYRGLAELSDLPEDALQDTLEGLEGDIQAKAESLLMVVSNMGGDTAAIDLEIKRLQARKRAIDNRKQSLRDYLKHNMEVSGISSIKCPLFGITLAQGRPIARIDDATSLPDEFVSVEVVRKPRKADILAALNRGDNVPGAELDVSEKSLRIR